MRFWRQTSGTHPPAISVVSPLPYFVSKGSMDSLQFNMNNNCLCYFTESGIIFRHKKSETIILHFHVLSSLSGRNRSIVSVIVDALIVILNSAILFELIGPVIHPCN